MLKMVPTLNHLQKSMSYSLILCWQMFAMLLLQAYSHEKQLIDVSANNNRLRQLCDACDMEFVENYQNFLLASGEIPESYYSRDKVHLNNYGTRKLLSTIDKVHRVAAQSQASVPDSSGRMYRPAFRASTGKSRPVNNNNRFSKFCHICMRNGHATQECWFKGRN